MRFVDAGVSMKPFHDSAEDRERAGEAEEEARESCASLTNLARPGTLVTSLAQSVLPVDTMI